MKKLILVFLMGLLLVSCGEQSNHKAESNQIPIVDFQGLQPLLTTSSDTTYIVNFWATWCSPCVKEIPYFEHLGSELSGEKIKIILVNLDFPNHYESRLIPFVKEKNIKSRVIMLDDANSNYWINEVSREWSGSIPATLIFSKNNREFYEKEFTYEELLEAVNKFL